MSILVPYNVTCVGPSSNSLQTRPVKHLVPLWWSPRLTCHSPTIVVPPTVATNTELPPGVTSGVGVDVSGASGVAQSSLVSSLVRTLVRTNVNRVGNVLSVCSAPGAASSHVRTGAVVNIAEEQVLNVGGSSVRRSTPEILLPQRNQ